MYGHIFRKLPPLNDSSKPLSNPSASEASDKPDWSSKNKSLEYGKFVKKPVLGFFFYDFYSRFLAVSSLKSDLCVFSFAARL